ncbi:MAG: translocation/assembly module TamB domain-containing protein [Dysgonamonadaceae bacterium]|nr:translocation/assembly module TamB domain-containing protein [Dysgonamonadaceae bacterium]
MLFLSFSIPAVQKWAADFALDKLKPKVKTEMSLESIRIKLFNRVELGGLYVKDQRNDTLLYAETLSARINAMNLLNNQLSLEAVRLENFTANVYRDSTEAPFNFQFFIDAFASKEPKPEKENSNPMKISIMDIELKNGSLHYNILSEPETPGIFNANHINIDCFNLKADLPSLDMENMKASIEKLSFREQSGIVVHQLSASANSKKKKFMSDGLNLKINDSEIDVSEAEYDLQTKAFKIKAKSDGLQAANAALFSEQLKSLSQTLSFDIEASGQLPSIDLKNLTVKYGTTTSISANGYISDCSKYQDAQLKINIDKIKTTASDIQTFARIGSPDLLLPEQVMALENLDLQLKAEGKLSFFSIDGDLKTTPGTVLLKGTGKANANFSAFEVDANVKTHNMRLTSILGSDIGADSLSLDADARFELKADKQIIAAAKGRVESISYKGYKYRNMFVDALYDGDNVGGTLALDNPSNKFNLQANLGLGKSSNISIHGTIDKLNLTPFFMRENWQSPILTARINADLKGQSIDDMAGTLLLDSLSLSDENFFYNPGAISLKALTDSAERKWVEIYSSFLEAEIHGDYYLSSIGDEFLHALSPHLPSILPAHEHKKDGAGKNKFDFQITVKNTEDLSYAFSLPLYNIEQGSITGNVNMTEVETIKVNAYFPRLMMGENDIRESKVNLSAAPESGINFYTNTYLVQDNGHINARLTSLAKADSVTNRLLFNVQNSVAQANGKIDVSLDFFRDLQDKLVTNIRLQPSDIGLNAETISLNPATIVQKQDSIVINNFGLTQRGKLLLGIEGVASKNKSDTIRAYFNNAEVANILAAIKIKDINGNLNGDIIIQQALNNPIIHTRNFRIDNLMAYKDTIGTLRMDANWDMKNTGLNIEAQLTKKGFRHLDIAGFVPTDETDPMNLSVKLNRLPLAWAQPFAESLFSQLSGTLNSDLKITGKTSSPVTEGWLGVDDGIMKIAFTNVTYYISDTIRISKDNVGLNDLVIRDDNNHTAKLNLSLTHANFGDMAYTANLSLNDFMLLNNSERSDMIAYGLLKLSGNITISGSSTGIYGEANLRNQSRSNITIEVPQTATATEYQDIIYINTPQEIDSLAFLKKDRDAKQNSATANNMPINIRARVNLNSDFEAGVMIDAAGNNLNINGNGELLINYNTKTVPSVTVRGDYIAESGKFHYNFQGLKSIDFNIKEGSKLTMVGDPLNTQFDITTYHQVKARLQSLNESAFSNMNSTRIPASAILYIKGNLNRMNLTYDIETPDLPGDDQQKVRSYINTDEAKTRQFASLLLSGDFSSSEGGIKFGSSGNTNMEATLAGYALKGLDALLSSALSDNWSISTNIDSNDGTLDNSRMGVDFSGRLFDDRLRIKTNLSYGDRDMLAGNESFMGEFDLEYDLYSWLMLHVYNHANQRFYKQAPTTQGIGIIVTKDGVRFKDLFRFRVGKKDENPPLPEKKEKKEEEPEPETEK